MAEGIACHVPAVEEPEWVRLELMIGTSEDQTTVRAKLNRPFTFERLVSKVGGCC